MSTDAFKYKRPFSPDDDTQQQVQNWHTPDLTADRAADTRTNALNKREPVAKSSVQEIEDELVVKPLTADDIEQMRQAAYDEGFTEGKDDGFSKGYAEGREQGAQDGFAQGQAEGKKQGLAEGQEELQQTLQQLTSLIEQLQNPLAAVDEQVKQNLLQLALAMAKAVVTVEVKTNPNVVLQALTDAIAALPLQADQLLIKLNPNDITVIEQHYSTQEQARRGWQLVAEPSVEQGGCLVESKLSTVDRSLSQRLHGALEHFISLQQHAESQQQTGKAVALDTEETNSGTISKASSETSQENSIKADNNTASSAAPDQPEAE